MNILGRLSGEVRRDKYYLALLLIFVVCVAALVLGGGRVASDGYNYYAYVRSAVIDGDLDFHNDFQHYGKAFWDTYKPRDTATGHYLNVFSIGPALLWSPFYLVAHAGVLISNALGGHIAADGFSAPYQLSISLASALYAFLGLLLLYRLLKQYFSPGLSFISVTALWLGSFLVYYMIFEPSMSHCVSFFSVTLFVTLWHNHRRQRSTRQWFLLGLTAGLMMLIRWQNGIYMLLPAIDSLNCYYTECKAGKYSEARNLLQQNLVFLAAVFLGFLPQMVVWKIIYGGFLTIPQGTSFMKWTEPFMLETLFSSRHGLFSWQPVLYLGFLGIFSLWRRDKRMVIGILATFIIVTYANSVVSDWWAGWAFGMRRFDGFLVFLGLGLGGTLHFLTELIRKRPALVATALVTFFILTNVLFINQFRGRVIHQGGIISFGQVFQNMVQQVYTRIGNPASFPDNALFALSHNESLARYDTLVGAYADDKYFYGSKMDLGKQRFYLGSGWYEGNEIWHGAFDYVHSTGAKPMLYLPLRSVKDYTVTLRLAPLSKSNPSALAGLAKLELLVNGQTKKSIAISNGWTTCSIDIPKTALHPGINTIQFMPGQNYSLGLDYVSFTGKDSLSKE